jgi:hypothetical protein
VERRVLILPGLLARMTVEYLGIDPFTVDVVHISKEKPRSIAQAGRGFT